MVLSLLYLIDFELEGQKFTSSEQAFMYYKAALFDDHETMEQVLMTNNCKEQKTLGRLIKGFVEHTLEQNCFDIVYKACLAKFQQNEAIKQELLSTGNLILVEAAKTDYVWGIGMSADDPDCTNPSKWKGKNYLGQVLMKVRANL